MLLLVEQEEATSFTAENGTGKQEKKTLTGGGGPLRTHNMKESTPARSERRGMRGRTAQRTKQQSRRESQAVGWGGVKGGEGWMGEAGGVGGGPELSVCEVPPTFSFTSSSSPPFLLTF